MIVPDVNLLVYAYNEAAPHHLAAREWWEGVMSEGVRVGLPWVVAMGFVRLVTYPRVTPRPLPPRGALSLVGQWIERSHVAIINPGPRHLDILGALFDAVGVAGRLTTDVHLAALAIEYAAELCSNDSDFARMPGLSWSNPLAR